MEPYQKEANEIIDIIVANPDYRKWNRLIADWLREFVAAREYGCTGLTTDPDGPELETPEFPSIEDWSKAQDRARRILAGDLTTIQQEILDEMVRDGTITRLDEEPDPGWPPQGS